MNVVTSKTKFSEGDIVTADTHEGKMVGKVVGKSIRMTNFTKRPIVSYFVFIPKFKSVHVFPSSVLSAVEKDTNKKVAAEENVVADNAENKDDVIKELKRMVDEKETLIIQLRKELNSLRDKIGEAYKKLDNISMDQLTDYGTGYIAGAQEMLSTITNNKNE